MDPSRFLFPPFSSKDARRPSRQVPPPLHGSRLLPLTSLPSRSASCFSALPLLLHVHSLDPPRACHLSFSDSLPAPLPTEPVPFTPTTSPPPSCSRPIQTARAFPSALISPSQDRPPPPVFPRIVMHPRSPYPQHRARPLARRAALSFPCHST